MGDERGHESGSMLLAFVLGGVTGAALALLLAPQSGRETRRKIAEYAEDAKDKAEGYADDAKQRAKSVVQKGKEFIDDKRSIISSAIEAGKEAYDREREKKGA